MNKQSTIGILGGMGPEASGYLYSTLISKAAKDFGAKNNDQFPEVILYSIPVPDFISDDKNKDQALRMLKNKVIELNATNISCLSIACNTAHVLLPQLRSISKVPFISIINEVAKRVSADGKRKVALLATPSTIKYSLYQLALKKYGIKVLIPNTNQLEAIEKIIRNVLRGKRSIQDNKKLIKIADSLKERGADGIILGCTELPLIFPTKYSLSVYNSTEILADALLNKYYKKNRIIE